MFSMLFKTDSKNLITYTLSSSNAYKIAASLSPFPSKTWLLRVCCTSLLKTLWGKGEIARCEQFLIFPQCFLLICRTFCHFRQISNCRLQTLSVWKSLKFVVWERVNCGRQVKS